MTIFPGRAVVGGIPAPMPLLVPIDTNPPPVQQPESDDFRDYVSGVADTVKGWLPQSTSQYLWTLSVPLVCIFLIIVILIVIAVRRLEKKRFYEQQLRLAYDPHPARPPIVTTVPTGRPALSVSSTPRTPAVPVPGAASPVQSLRQSPPASTPGAGVPAFSVPVATSPFGTATGTASPAAPQSLRGSPRAP